MEKKMENKKARGVLAAQHGQERQTMGNYKTNVISFQFSRKILENSTETDFQIQLNQLWQRNSRP